MLQKQGIGSHASACGDSLIVPEQLPVCCKELLRLASSGASYDLRACVLQIRRTRARGHSSASVRVCVCVTLGAPNRGSACSGFVFASTRMCHCLRVGGVMRVLMCAADLYKLLRCVTQCVRTLIVGLQRLCVIDCKHMCMQKQGIGGHGSAETVCLRMCSCCREARNPRGHGSARVLEVLTYFDS